MGGSCVTNCCYILSLLICIAVASVELWGATVFYTKHRDFKPNVDQETMKLLRDAVQEINLIQIPISGGLLLLAVGFLPAFLLSNRKTLQKS